MLRNKNIILSVLIAFIMAGCIEPFVPRITDEPAFHYVVSGEVTDQEGYQVVTVTTTSSISNPEYLPARNCTVEIQDDRSGIFACEELEDGKYRVWMNKEFLAEGTSYRVRIVTPAVGEILSTYEKMPEHNDIDTIYFERKISPTENPDVNIRELQFYVDINGADTGSRYYRWNIEETWEYHVSYPVIYYFDGRIGKTVPPDYSRKICWSTQRNSNIYTLSTRNLVSNKYEKFPLHNVPNTTAKLYFGYCATINQYTISESAYNFWEKLRINSEETGGLYEKQPLPVEGNLSVPTNPGQKVLGYFGASSKSMQRIFIKGIRDMDVPHDTICATEALSRFGWSDYSPSEYPIYFVYIERKVRIISEGCYNCEFHGGTIVKPDFWIW